jgi:nicotinamidase-related amidase
MHECQNGMINPAIASNGPLARHAESRGVVENIARLAAACRELGLPVVHSTIEPRPDLAGTDASCLLLGSLLKKGAVVAGSPYAEIHPRLTPQDGDIRIRRVHGLTPFHGTELEWYLRERGVRTVILTGVSSDVGIPGAALEAVNRGFRAVVPEDGIAGSSPEAHEWQVSRTIPLLATVSDTEGVIAELRSHATS